MLSLSRARIQSLVGELRSYKPRKAAKKKKKEEEEKKVAYKILITTLMNLQGITNPVFSFHQ